MVIHRGKILALYKSYKNRYEGWVLPKGTVEPGETHEQTALREVKEEADVRASIVKYVGKNQYNFTVPEDMVNKEVHWYLMTADNYHSKPQREEFFVEMCIRDRSFRRQKRKQRSLCPALPSAVPGEEFQGKRVWKRRILPVKPERYLHH